jgi:phenylalanyl-tRNA synthetase beta subunit
LNQTEVPDFNWDLIIKRYQVKKNSPDIPKYPEVRRDLAFAIDQNVRILFMLLRDKQKKAY